MDASKETLRFAGLLKVQSRFSGVVLSWVERRPVLAAYLDAHAF
jgi:hypothetical protein